jgi:hypothetical protein
LVSPLDGAIALAQVHDVAVAVGQNLKLDVAGPLDKFFQVDPRVAKGGLGLALGGHKGFAHVGFGLHQAHAPPAAPAVALIITG